MLQDLKLHFNSDNYILKRAFEKYLRNYFFIIKFDLTAKFKRFFRQSCGIVVPIFRGGLQGGLGSPPSEKFYPSLIPLPLLVKKGVKIFHREGVRGPLKIGTTILKDCRLFNEQETKISKSVHR